MAMNPVPMPEIPPMSPEEFRESLQALGFARFEHSSHTGIAPAMEWLDLSRATGTRLASGSLQVSPAIAALLRIMRHYQLSPDDVARLSAP